MLHSKNIVKVDTIACATCLEEIPRSVRKNAEADEYVSNYCGLECYQLWLGKNAKKIRLNLATTAV